MLAASPRCWDATLRQQECFGLLDLGNCWYIHRSPGPADKALDVAALAVWSGMAWAVLSWTTAVEQAVYGAVISIAVAVALSPLGPAARPWRLLHPKRLVRVAAVAVLSVARIVWANVVLAWRVWSPSRPIRTGMLVVPAGVSTDGAITAIGLLGSIIVDHQLVDLERGRLQYHAVWVESEDPDDARERINGRMERLLLPLDEETRGD
ncbi:MAG: Na+/H+ antiporter subunit E [Actinomycetota bacterium]|nr:Na+/H+ antiporter subunit E [Actinomycetota bacterium]